MGDVTDFDAIRVDEIIFRKGGGFGDTVRIGITASPFISTDVAHIFLPKGGRIIAVQGYCDSVPLGSSTNLTVDVNVNGVTIYTNQAHRLIWPTSAHMSSNFLPDVVDIPDQAVISMDFDQVSSDALHPGGPGIYVSLVIAHSFNT